MGVSLKNGQIILVDDDVVEGTALMRMLRTLGGHAIDVQIRSEVYIVLQDLGRREEACREPINITRSVDPRYVAISNLHPTAFILDDEIYSSIEGFWQSLKCESLAHRRQVAALSGTDAKKAVGRGAAPPTFNYRGEIITTGTFAHWLLMERACLAKFTQNTVARAALLATGNRPLTHIVRGDSRAIPGVIMAAIWMRIREQMVSELGAAANNHVGFA